MITPAYFLVDSENIPYYAALIKILKTINIKEVESMPFNEINKCDKNSNLLIVGKQVLIDDDLLKKHKKIYITVEFNLCKLLNKFAWPTIIDLNQCRMLLIDRIHRLKRIPTVGNFNKNVANTFRLLNLWFNNMDFLFKDNIEDYYSKYLLPLKNINKDQSEKNTRVFVLNILEQFDVMALAF